VCTTSFDVGTNALDRAAPSTLPSGAPLAGIDDVAERTSLAAAGTSTRADAFTDAVVNAVVGDSDACGTTRRALDAIG
jgi:hypothetical protein